MNKKVSVHHWIISAVCAVDYKSQYSKVENAENVH